MSPRSTKRAPGASYLLLLDIRMPKVDGIEVLRQLKADPETKDIATVGFVSHVQTDLMKQAQQRGCGTVVPRSAFARDLEQILARAATGR